MLEEALRDNKRKKGNTTIDGQERRPCSAVPADTQNNSTVLQTLPIQSDQAASGHAQVIAGAGFRCMAGTGQAGEANSQLAFECLPRTGSSAGQPRLPSAAGVSGSGVLSSWASLPAEPVSAGPAAVAAALQHNPRIHVPAPLGSAQGSGCLLQQQQPDPLCPFGRRSVTCSSWGAGAAPVQDPTHIMGAAQRDPSPSALPFERTSICSYNGVPSSAPAPAPASSSLPFERGSACGYVPASSTPAAQPAAAHASASPFARGSSCGYNYQTTGSNALGALATWQQQLNGDGRAPAVAAGGSAAVASPFERTSSSFGASPAPPALASAPSLSPFERGSACGYTANTAAAAAHASIPALPSLGPAPTTSQPLGRTPSIGPTAPLFTALDQRQQQRQHRQQQAAALLPGLDRTSTLSSSFIGATCDPASVGGCGTETDAEGKSHSPLPAAPPSPQLQLPSAASDGPDRSVMVGGRAVVLTPAAAADPLAATAAACLNTAAQQLKMLQQQQQQMLVQQQQLAAQQQILQQQIMRQRQEQQREQQQEQEGRKGASALQAELFPPIPASLLYQRLSAGHTEASAGAAPAVTVFTHVPGPAASAGGVGGALQLAAGRQPAGPARSFGSRPSPFSAALKPPAQQFAGPTAMAAAAGAFRGAVSINPGAAAAAVAAGGIAVQHGQQVAGGGMSLARVSQPQQHMQQLQQQQVQLQQMQLQLAASGMAPRAAGAVGAGPAAVPSAVAACHRACQQQQQEQEADQHLYEELLRALE